MARWTVGGVSLDTLAWNVGNRDAAWQLPAKRNTNLEMFGRDGAQYVPHKTYAQGSVPMSMFVLGCLPDGTFPSSPSRAQLCRDNLETLYELFAETAGLLEVRRIDPWGTRRFFGEVVDQVRPKSMAGGTRAELEVEWQVPSVFWEDVSTVTANGSGPGDVALTELAGSSARITDAVIVLTGASGTITLKDKKSGSWLRIAGATSAAITINCRTFTVTQGGVSLAPQMSRGGASPLLTLTPYTLTSPPVLNLSSAGTVAVTARRKYLIA